MMIIIVIMLNLSLQQSGDTDDGSVSFVITTSSGAFAVGDVLQGQSTFTITTTSALAFAPGDIISGASSSSTATVVSAPDSTTLEVRSVNAPFTANEVISSTTAQGTYVSTTTPAAATIKKVDGSTGLSVVPSAGSFSANEVISAPNGSNAVGVYKSSDADTSDSDSRNVRTWVVILLVLAIVCTVLCCCVLAILAKHNADDCKDMAALPTPFKIGIGVLAAIIIILLVAIICPIKEWNSGSTAISATNKHSYKVGLFETNLKDERTVCCDANGNSYDTTDSDVTSNNYGKTKDAGEVAFSLLVGAIILIFVAAVLAVFLFSPTMMIAAIVLTAVAFILETAAWANWADKVGDNDTDYGACFIIAVVVWCLLLLFLLLLIAGYLKRGAADVAPAAVAAVVPPSELPAPVAAVVPYWVAMPPTDHHPKCMCPACVPPPPEQPATSPAEQPPPVRQFKPPPARLWAPTTGVDVDVAQSTISM